MQDIALLTRIFLGKKANLLQFIWFGSYFFNVFAADLNLRKNVSKIDKPPSFLLWRIRDVKLLPMLNLNLKVPFVLCSVYNSFLLY